MIPETILCKSALQMSGLKGRMPVDRPVLAGSDRYQTLVPKPVTAQWHSGTYELTSETALIAATGAEDAATVVRLLLAPLRLPLRPAGSGKGITVHLDPGLPGGPEAY